MSAVGDNGTHRSDIEMRRKQLKTQQSTVHTRRQQAVCVRRACKRYGTKKNPFVILDGLNMTVPKGTIYGLLGASGCGKTTLLSCIVGRRRLNSGEIWVLGGTPGSRGSGVPGPRIGYMPQEIALYGEFTIKETMTYFGWIAGMTTEKIEQRMEFLMNLLMLPPASRTVKNLSGGQQRRVSFAAALIHEPELLILDEPTVGVDPLLRQNIWDHLVEITKGRKTTVIITTHYIDETRQAHTIGLMRGGYFLAEESPDRLMAQYGAETLEDVFLKLSVIQNMGKRRRSSILHSVTEAISVPQVAGVVNDAIVLDDDPGEISGEFGDNVSLSGRSRRVSIIPEDVDHVPEMPPEEDVPSTWTEKFSIIKLRHMKALIWKNFLWMWRNFGVMAFIIGLPVAQIVLFCLSIGHDAKDIHLSVANYEFNMSRTPCETLDYSCNSTSLSCNFLKEMENRHMIMDYFDTSNEAIDAVRKGNAWAALIFQSNYSDALKERVTNGRFVEEWDIESSEITVYQDKSNENIASLMFRDFYVSYLNYIQDFLESCNITRKIGAIPIRMNTPVYGKGNPNFTDFAAPGVILTTIFFLAVALTSGAMLMERNEGIMERSLVNGINAVEMLFSHVTTQFVIMCIQTILVLVFSFAVFNITNLGFMPWIVILTLLSGLCGMCFGFVVSCACENERSATYLAMGSFLPIVMLCGIVWPIEGMHKILQFISVFLPLTLTTEALRSMLMRGWGMEETAVWSGFVSIAIWAAIFLSISIMVIKFKKG